MSFLIRALIRKLRKHLSWLDRFVLYIVKKKKDYRIWKKYIYPIKKKYLFNRDIWFFLYTPTHGNLGDHAIAIAAENTFKRLNIDYYEISIEMLFEYRELGILNVFDKSNIVLNGGGNLGTLWMNCEQLTRDIIKCNPNSKIVILPNSFYYENTQWGHEQLEESIKIYNNHKKLFIFARELISFEAMREIYNNVFIAPDMVFSLDCPIDINAQRSGILVCLRDDKEKTLPKNDRIKLDDELNTTKLTIRYTDTVLAHNIAKADREKYVYNKLDEFKKAQLVITDRLHGMIFSVITGTPCIVINSKSPKIIGCLEWVKDCDYVKYADSVENIPKLLSDLISKHEKRFVISEKEYAKIYCILKEF